MTHLPHPGLRVETSGPVLTLTLCQPDRLNTQTPTFWYALAEVAAGLTDRVGDDVRVVVIRAEGRAFSAGLDRGMFASPPTVAGEPDILAAAAHDPTEAAGLIAGMQEGFAAWRRVPAVVVAAVQGHAIGAGAQLALAADLRVVADDVHLALREVSLGLVPDLGGTAVLTPLVGYPRALEICATGRAVGAQELVRLGLANVAVPRAELDEATDDLVQALLAAPPATLFALKHLLVQAIASPYADQLRHEREAQAPLLHLLAQGAARHTQGTGAGTGTGTGTGEPAR